MFGHGCPLVEPDGWPVAPWGGAFWPGVGVRVDVEPVDVDVGALAALAVLVVLASDVLAGDAAAPAIPAAAPPVASAPATMVAPSILEMVMWIEPPGVGWGCADHVGSAR